MFAPPCQAHPPTDDAARTEHYGRLQLPPLDVAAAVPVVDDVAVDVPVTVEVAIGVAAPIDVAVDVSVVVAAAVPVADDVAVDVAVVIDVAVAVFRSHGEFYTIEVAAPSQSFVISVGSSKGLPSFLLRPVPEDSRSASACSYTLQSLVTPFPLLVTTY